jgi:plasmid replication initiation protein
MTENKSGELIAVMANAIAESRHSLTVPEQRIILWLVSQIEREDDALKEHTLSVLEFEEILGGENTSGTLYERIEQAVDRLQSRVLEIRTGPNERTKFNWLHLARYLEGEGKVRLQFHDLLKPVLLQLRERFCQIPLRAIFKMRGGYAIRFLERLYSRRHEGSFALSIPELRDWLHIEPEELQRTDNLQARAIDVPKRELDAKSALTFTYKPKKEGRRIVGWVFTIRENKPAKKARLKSTPPAVERITPDSIAALRGAVGRQ